MSGSAYVQIKENTVYIKDNIKTYLWLVRVVSIAMATSGTMVLYSGVLGTDQLDPFSIIFNAVLVVLGVYALVYSSFRQSTQTAIPANEIVRIRKPWIEFGRSSLQLKNGMSRIIACSLSEKKEQKLKSLIE